MKRNQVDVITLGCSKNLVDSERVMSLLEEAGFKVTHDTENPQGEIAVVNTCGFIGDAKEESVNMILELAQAKTEGRLRRLYVMGCLSERYRKELMEEIPEVDRFYGKFDWVSLASDLKRVSGIASKTPYQRHLTTPKHYAYLKISEGCNRHCAYCAIPIITGSHQSRPMEEILDEVRDLVKKGVKEFQVIAQELTYYGMDLYHERRISELIDRMADIEGVEWIRLHYAYPTAFPMDLLEVMARRKNVCKYLDIALQHISDSVLKDMRRHITKKETLKLIEDIRKAVPGIHLRTTLMVGFPGETQEDFHELTEFVSQAKFERMGAFMYSEEEGTPSAQLPETVLPEEKQRRVDIIMDLQKEISAKVNEDKIGKTLRVIVDRKEGAYYVCRSEFDSPEVDPEILVSEDEGVLNTGEFYQVTITQASDYDLMARLAHPSSADA